MIEGMVGTIFGAILGFLLAQFGVALQEKRNDKKRSQSVKTILRIEIERNLDIVREFWVDKNKIDISNDWERATRQVRAFLSEPRPKFQREALNSQLSTLAYALEEREIVSLFEFYYLLSKLESKEILLKQRLEDQESQQEKAKQELLQKMKEEKRNPFPAEMHNIPTPFDNTAAYWWEENNLTVQALLNIGNPFMPENIQK